MLAFPTFSSPATAVTALSFNMLARMHSNRGGVLTCAACCRTCSSSGCVMSLMAGWLLATMATAVPRRSSSRAKGIMPSTASAPLLSTNSSAREWGAGAGAGQGGVG